MVTSDMSATQLNALILRDAYVILSAGVTLNGSHNGRTLYYAGSGAITVTAPVTLPLDFSCAIVQCGSGAVTVTAGAGATVSNRQSFVKTAGQYAGIGLLVDVTVGVGHFILLGDGST